ncbi:MAG: hypothetical protein WB952_18630 [Terriglobales bacterium]
MSDQNSSGDKNVVPGMMRCPLEADQASGIVSMNGAELVFSVLDGRSAASSV